MRSPSRRLLTLALLSTCTVGCSSPTDIVRGAGTSTTTTPPAASSTTAPSTTAPPTTATTLAPTTAPPAPTTTVDPNRIDASTVLRRGAFGPIRLGMTVSQLEAMLGPLDVEVIDDSDPSGAYCGSFSVPGAEDVYVGVFTERGGRAAAAVEEIGVYEGRRPSEFGIRIGDPAGAVMAARVENLVRKPHVYDPAGAYLESDTAGGGFRFQVSDLKVTEMQTGRVADSLSVEGFCI